MKYTNSGIAYIRFNLAVNRTFTNAQGEKEADFVPCVVWRKQAENMAKFVGKGSLIGVEGKIQTGRFENNEGKTVYTTDVLADRIQFLETKKKDAPQQNNNNNYTRVEEDPFTSNGGPIDVKDSDLPF